MTFRDFIPQLFNGLGHVHCALAVTSEMVVACYCSHGPLCHMHFGYFCARDSFFHSDNLTVNCFFFNENSRCCDDAGCRDLLTSFAGFLLPGHLMLKITYETKWNIH